MKRIIRKEELVDYVRPEYQHISLDPNTADYEIFVNATPSELNSIFTWRTDKIVRGLVDTGNKDVYIFDYNVIHFDALDQILQSASYIDEYDISNIEIHGKKKFIKNTYQSLPIKDVPWIQKYFSSYRILSDNPFDRYEIMKLSF